MSTILKNIIARNLRCPENNIFGFLVSKLVFDTRHIYLEKNAVHLCKVQPHHKVLEIGFGTGHGLKEAAKIIKDGTGVIYGIEQSELMIKRATSLLKSEIEQKKVNLCYGCITQLPYNTDMFDSVFHCNSYYFWPDMKSAVRELHRVMKPGSTMVATMNSHRIKLAQKQGLMKYGQPDPVHFMWHLENYGFEDVRFEYCEDGGDKFEAIVARVNEKDVHDEEFEKDNVPYSNLHFEGGKPCYKISEHGLPSLQ